MTNLETLCELAEKRGLHVGLSIMEPSGKAGERPPPIVNALHIVRPRRSGSKPAVLASFACGVESVEKAAEAAVTKLTAHA